jgi:hypothetical protein
MRGSASESVPETVTLDGSATDSNDPALALSFSWAQTSGLPVVFDSAKANADIHGADGRARRQSASSLLTVPNIPPT